jgi:superfamily II DNA or RNA helicase
VNDPLSRPLLIPEYIPQPSIQLRDYQLTMLADLDDRINEGHRRILVSASTGSGKTATMAAFARRAYQQRLKTTILVPSNCVVTKSVSEPSQMCGALIQQGLSGKFGVFSGAFPELSNEYAPIQIVTLQTLQAKGAALHQWLQDTDVVILDEGHSAAFFKEAEKAYELWAWKLILNFTATPFNRGMGIDERHGNLQRNTALVNSPSYLQLQERGYLAPLQYHSVIREDLEKDEKLDLDSDAAISSMLDRWLGKCRELRIAPRYAVGFTKAAKNGRSQAKTIQAIGSSKGIRFEIVGDGVSQSDYERYMQAYESGECNLLCVQALSTGWDSPVTQHCLLFRQIKSRDRYVQIVGRVSRPYAGKQFGHVWDFARNWDFAGDGSGLHPKIELLSESIDESVLQYKAKGEGSAPVKSCIHCDKSIAASLLICPHCKTEQPQASVRLVSPDGQLVSFIDESIALASKAGAIAYFRQWRKIAYAKRWKPFAAMARCESLGIKVKLDDPKFWLGSIFESDSAEVRSFYREYLLSMAQAWGWDREKVDREVKREFGQ